MAILTYNWIREKYDEAEDFFKEIPMSTDLEISIIVKRGQFSGPPEDCWPDEWDVNIIGGVDDMTDDEIEAATDWLYEQDFEEILRNEKSYYDESEYDSWKYDR